MQLEEGAAVRQSAVERSSFARPAHLSRDIALYVRDFVISGQPCGGQQLNIDQLDRDWGISTTSVREALPALKGEGFVEFEPCKGFRVAPLSRRDIDTQREAKREETAVTTAAPYGATGPFFEDFFVGQRLVHGGRTITKTDNIWFTLLTCNTNPIHYDDTYAEETEFGKTLINSALTMAVATGLSVADLSRSGINLGWDHVVLANPLYPGDTLLCESEIVECRLSQSRRHMGLVRARTTGRNQSRTEVIRFERTILLYRRPTTDNEAQGQSNKISPHDTRER